MDSGIGNARWVNLRAEDLPAGLGCFRYATFGQSFHWVDHERVAAITFDLLDRSLGRKPTSGLPAYL